MSYPLRRNVGNGDSARPFVGMAFFQGKERRRRRKKQHLNEDSKVEESDVAITAMQNNCDTSETGGAHGNDDDDDDDDDDTVCTASSSTEATAATLHWTEDIEFWFQLLSFAVIFSFDVGLYVEGAMPRANLNIWFIGAVYQCVMYTIVTCYPKWRMLFSICGSLFVNCWLFVRTAIFYNTVLSLLYPDGQEGYHRAFAVLYFFFGLLYNLVHIAAIFLSRPSAGTTTTTAAYPQR